MQSPAYEELLSSVQQLVRQAYTLGRSEALKQVVDVLQADPVPAKPLALAAPDSLDAAKADAEPKSVTVVHPAQSPAASSAGAGTDPVAQGPWWSRSPRK